MERNNDEQRPFFHKAGVTYYTKRTERRVLFLLTLAMLTWGVIDYAVTLF
jgi:hypothetical protein